MPVEKVREIMRVAQEPVSLETPIGEEEDSHLGDFIQDEDAPAPVSYTHLHRQAIPRGDGPGRRNRPAGPQR